MASPKFLLTRTADGKCILRLEGSKCFEEFGDVLEAIPAARKLQRLAALTNGDGEQLLNQS